MAWRSGFGSNELYCCRNVNSLLSLIQELSSLRTELTNASHSGTKASTALEFESKMRGSLENRMVQLESELSKAWEQVKELTEKVSTLEATKRQLEIGLDKVNLFSLVIARH